MDSKYSMYNTNTRPAARHKLGVSTVLKSSIQRRKLQLQSKCPSKPKIKGKSVDAEECVQLCVIDPSFMHRLWLQFPYVFRIGDHAGCGPTLLQEVCLERGWKEFVDEEEGGSPNVGWNLWWLHNNMSARSFQSLSSWQITNHMDRSFGFTSKDICTRYIRRLKNTYGEVYDLCPLSFNVPSEYTRLCLAHTQRKSRIFWNFFDRANQVGSPLYRTIELEKQPIWICKPVGKSQGRGITVFDTVTELTYTTRSVVQEYITRPHLIGGYKWDLRIYVCIVSTSPLVFYAYREGLVRFATNFFDLRNLYNPYAHLTNSSLNKLSPNYLKNKTGVGRGCKWSLRKLRRYFRDKSIPDWYLWQRISSMLILTIIGDAPSISTFQRSSTASNFSLMGFDIMVDKDLRPYLAEVNSNPSLSNDCEVDRLVKKPMLHDLFDLLNLPDLREFEVEAGSHSRAEPVRYQQPTHPIGPSSDSEEYSAMDSDYESGDPNDEMGDDHDREYPRTLKFYNIHPSSTDAFYMKGPVPAFREIVDFTTESSQYFVEPSVDIHYQPDLSPQKLKRHRKLCLPALVTVPIRKETNTRKRRQPYISEWRTGLTLEIPKWGQNSPTCVGDWIRIFPFDSGTEKLAPLGTGFDVKEGTRRVQELLKCAEMTNKLKAAESDIDKDAYLAEKAELTTRIWHPPNGIGHKTPRY